MVRSNDKEIIFECTFNKSERWYGCTKSSLFGELHFNACLTFVSQMQTTMRLDEDDYKQAREILEYIGMSYSQAINMFNRMVVFNHGLPFEAKVPNKKTINAMKEAKELDGEFIMIDELRR